MHNGVLRNIIADLAHFRTCLQFECFRASHLLTEQISHQRTDCCYLSTFGIRKHYSIFFFLICISNKIILAIH